jgi:hypothetical protein
MAIHRNLFSVYLIGLFSVMTEYANHQWIYTEEIPVSSCVWQLMKLKLVNRWGMHIPIRFEKSQRGQKGINILEGSTKKVEIRWMDGGTNVHFRDCWVSPRKLGQPNRYSCLIRSVLVVRFKFVDQLGNRLQQAAPMNIGSDQLSMQQASSYCVIIHDCLALLV